MLAFALCTATLPQTEALQNAFANGSPHMFMLLRFRVKSFAQGTVIRVQGFCISNQAKSFVAEVSKGSDQQAVHQLES